MLPLTFKSNKCRLLVEREKGLPNLLTFLKAHCSKIKPGIAIPKKCPSILLFVLKTKRAILKNCLSIFISVGVNCHFDPFTSLDALKVMKKGLADAGLLDTTHLMCQPLAYLTPDASKQGFIDLPEFPFALEPRVCTRLMITAT